MFWALAQREKDIEKGRQQGREEGRQQGREEGKEEGRQQGREEVLRKLQEQSVDIPPEILRELEEFDRESRRP